MRRHEKRPGAKDAPSNLSAMDLFLGKTMRTPGEQCEFLIEDALAPTLAEVMERRGGRTLLDLYESLGQRGPSPMEILVHVWRRRITSRLRQGSRSRALLLVLPAGDGKDLALLDSKLSPKAVAGAVLRYLERKRAIVRHIESRLKESPAYPQRQEDLRHEALLDTLIIVCLHANAPPGRIIEELVRHRYWARNRDMKVLEDRLKKRIRRLRATLDPQILPQARRRQAARRRM